MFRSGSGFCIVSMATLPMSYQIITLSSPMLLLLLRLLVALTVVHLPLVHPRSGRTSEEGLDERGYKTMVTSCRFLTTYGTSVHCLSAPTLFTFTHNLLEGRHGTFNSLFRGMKNSERGRKSWCPTPLAIFLVVCVSLSLRLFRRRVFLGRPSGRELTRDFPKTSSRIRAESLLELYRASETTLLTSSIKIVERGRCAPRVPPPRSIRKTKSLTGMTSRWRAYVRQAVNRGCSGSLLLMIISPLFPVAPCPLFCDYIPLVVSTGHVQ